MIKSVWYPPFSERPMADKVYNAVFGNLEKADDLGWHAVLTIYDKPVAAGRLDYVKAGVGKISRVAVLSDNRRMQMGDSIVRLLIFKAAELGITCLEAEAQGDGEHLLIAMGFTETEKNKYEKEICDGCCDGCKDKRACEEK